MSSLIKLEHLPIEKILEFFQTKKIIKNEKIDNYQFNKLITQRRKLISIKTDIKTLLNLSMTNKYFNDLIKKSDLGKLLFTVYYNSSIITEKSLEHISYCPQFDCTNICHYVNKDIKHTNILKKIVIKKFNELKSNTKFKKDIIPFFKCYLTSKQIESYYKIKKMNKKLKDDNEKTKSCESSELDSISINSDCE